MRSSIVLLCILLLPFTLLFGQTGSSPRVTPGNCLSYETSGSQVVFHCQNAVNVMLKLCAPRIIRFWYEKGEFKRDNPSFSVVDENIDNKGDWTVNEQPGSYELYTSLLIIRIDKAPFKLRIFDKYQKLLMEDYGNKGFERDSAEFSAFRTLRKDEQIYGLGEKNGGINKRGQKFEMWNSDKPCYDVNEDPLYKSIPFFMSSSGYGIFFDNTYKTSFDFGSENPDCYSFSAPGGEMLFYFIYGPTLKQIIGRYTQLTGAPIMPPNWALGFSQCRGLLTNEALTREIAAGYRQRQIPCDIIYQDIGWTQYLQDFNWRKGNYHDPRKMVADLKEQGFRVIVSQDPVISKENRKQWTEADSAGFFTTDIRTGKTYDMPWPWGGNCGVVDFTKPAVADWWGNYQQKVINDGVSGFWTDMGEPAWCNEESTDRLFMKHYLGMHNEIHNVYGLTWDKVVTEQFEKHNPNQRIFQMTRAGFAGMQRYTFGWSGDAGNGNSVTEGWSKLKAQIPLALSAGMSGNPFWSCDISGYCGDIQDYPSMSELYVRWLQFGVFNPISRAHHEGNNAVEPWLFGQEAELACKKAIELKYSLFPYLYTYAREAWDKGLPIMRAMALEFPDDPEACKAGYQFMFGKELLVAPVFNQSAAVWKIYLPEGKWVNFNHPEQIFNGLQWIEIPVSLETIPVFVRKGSVIPQMPVMQYIFEKKDAPLWFEVFPSEDNHPAVFRVYEDDGVTNDYKRNICTRTSIECTPNPQGMLIRLSREGQSVTNRNLGVRIRMEKKPSAILMNSRKISVENPEKMDKGWYEISSDACWSYDKKTQTCWIKVPDNAYPMEILIKND